MKKTNANIKTKKLYDILTRENLKLFPKKKKAANAYDYFYYIHIIFEDYVKTK